MKTFVIYNRPVDRSYVNAVECKGSFLKYKGWDVELFDGCNPNTIDQYNMMYGLSDARASNPKLSKKSCFYSHYHLWRYSADNGVPVAIVENDTECEGDCPEIVEEGVFHLSIETNITMKAHGRDCNKDFALISNKPDGIHSVEELSQTNLHTGKKCMPGSTAYIITPKAAKSLIRDCEKNGWYQNDSLITTGLVNLNYIKPSPVRYCRWKELRSSSEWRT